MRTIYVSPEFPLNRRMRKDVRRGKLQVVREGGERSSLGGGIPSGKGRGLRMTGSPLVCMADNGAEVGGGGEVKEISPIGHPEDYINGYKIAAEILCSRSVEYIEINSLGFPIFYLYRHYVELEMKLLCHYLGGIMARHNYAEADEFLIRPTHDLCKVWETAKKCLIKAWEIDGENVAFYIPAVKRKARLESDYKGDPFSLSSLLQTPYDEDEQSVDLKKNGNEFDKIVKFFHTIDPKGDRGRYPMDRGGHHHALKQLDVAELKEKTDKFSALFASAWCSYDMLITSESDMPKEEY